MQCQIGLFLFTKINKTAIYVRKIQIKLEV